MKRTGTNHDATRQLASAALAATVALVLVSCAGLGKTARDISRAAGADENLVAIIGGAGTALESFGGIAWEEERAIGGALAVQVVARYGGAFQSDVLNDYLNVLGTAVADSSDRPGIPYHFLVLDEATPNAFAAPGGYIFVTRGIVAAARDEAELAGVLGHEIAHVSEGHTLAVLKRGKLLKGLTEAGAGALKKDPAVLGSVVDEASSLLFERGLDQSMEFDADRLGTDFAARVGYDPTGLRRFVGTLGAMRGYDRSALFKTHPSPASRVARMDGVLAAYRRGYADAKVQDRFERIKRGAGLASTNGARGDMQLANAHEWCAHAPSG